MEHDNLAVKLSRLSHLQSKVSQSKVLDTGIPLTSFSLPLSHNSTSLISPALPPKYPHLTSLLGCDFSYISSIDITK